MWLVAIFMAAGAWVFGPSAAMAEEKGNVVFFRGGYAGLSSNRGNEVFTDVNGASGRNNNNSGYYVGGGLDLALTKDLWGMMDKIAAVGEIGVEFKRFSSNRVRNTTSALLGGTQNSVTQITMLTVDIAPKLKFMEGSAFRPWIIPIGLDFHVISPPSNNSNYLDIGVQFGAGFEYQVWKELKLGADARYHLASNQTSTVNNFFTVGPYVGIGF
jgi:opacity protein-like surface antigen